MKLDTSKDRYDEMAKLFRKATKIDDEFRREVENMTLGDIICLLAMMQNLTAMDELIRTEMVFEKMLAEMQNVEGETEETRRKFIDIFGNNEQDFLKKILLGRVNVAINMAEYAASMDPRLSKFQKEMFKTMTALREKYKELYKI